MKPLISIIIPVYNAERYLTECIDSIVSQFQAVTTQLTPTSQTIELILIDDGSTDTSGKICDDYATRHTNIQVIHKQNGGVASARNDGLKHATGEYVFFIDNDDWLSPTALTEIVSALTQTQADVLINRYHIVEPHRTSLGNHLITASEIVGKSQEHVLTYFRTKRINILAPWEYVAKREIITKNNLSFSPQQNGVDDSVFTPLLFCSAQSFHILDSITYNWRQRADSQGKKHTSSSYCAKMLSTIESLKTSLAKYTAQAQQNYLYFSIYKNMFSLIGEYSTYSGQDQHLIKKYVQENHQLIKQAARASGLVHRSCNALFGNFVGLRVSYKIAVLKGKMHTLLSPAKYATLERN